MRTAFGNIGLVWRDQALPHNRQRWSGKTNWRQLRLVGGWCLLVVWPARHWRGEQ